MGKEIFIKEFMLEEHFLGINRDFFICRSDFVNSMIDSFSIDKNKLHVAKNLLSVIPRVVKLTYINPYHLKVLFSRKVEKINKSKKELFLNNFHVRYRIISSLRIFFNKEIITSYEFVSNFLWKLKWVENSLFIKWKILREIYKFFISFSSRKINLNPNEKKFKHIFNSILCYFYLVRARMNNFVGILQSFISKNVVEKSWNKFLKNMKSANNLKKINDYHIHYIEAMKKKIICCEDDDQFMIRFNNTFEVIVNYLDIVDSLQSNLEPYKTELKNNSHFNDVPRRLEFNEKNGLYLNYLKDIEKILIIKKNRLYQLFDEFCEISSQFDYLPIYNIK